MSATLRPKFEIGQTVRIMRGFYQGFQARIESPAKNGVYKVYVIEAKAHAEVSALDIRPPRPNTIAPLDN